MPKDGANSVVLDASALIALLRGEPGRDAVAEHIPGAVIGSVNYSEVLKKAVEYGGTLEGTRSVLADLQLNVVPFDAALAEQAAALWPATREFGLSLADRCCLAMAISMRRPALTTDREWKKLKLGIDVRVIR